jgi:hypothetical protein
MDRSGFIRDIQFGIYRLQKSFEKIVALPADLPGALRVKQVLEIQEFFCDMTGCIPYFSFMFTGPHESPGNTGCAHRVELVGIRENFCFRGLRLFVGAVPVRPDGVGDLAYAGVIVPDIPEHFFCDPGPFLFMGKAFGFLKGPGNIVQECCGNEDPHVGLFLTSYDFAEPGDPFDMIEPVGAGGFERCLHVIPEVFFSFVHKLPCSFLNPEVPGYIGPSVKKITRRPVLKNLQD